MSSRLVAGNNNCIRTKLFRPFCVVGICNGCNHLSTVLMGLLTIQSPFPNAKLITGTFSSNSTCAFSFAPGNKSVAFAHKRFVRKRSDLPYGRPRHFRVHWPRGQNPETTRIRYGRYHAWNTYPTHPGKNDWIFNSKKFCDTCFHLSSA